LDKRLLFAGTFGIFMSLPVIISGKMKPSGGLRLWIQYNTGVANHDVGLYDELQLW